MAIKSYANGTRYLGLSTDEKPSNVTLGAGLLEVDTNLEYIFNGEEWICKNQKTYEWLSQEIAPGSFFSADIPAAGFDLATAFVSGTGNIQISFRVATPSGNNYAWDPLGTMNGASMRASSQATISGIEVVKVVASNNTEEAVIADIYAYLGKR